MGNEPNVYLKTYPEYKDALVKHMEVISAADVAPNAVFCGPSSTPGKGLWSRDLANELGKGGKLKIITQHSYPGSSAKRVTDVADARAKMLSTDWVAGYQKMFDAIMPSVTANGLKLRLEECNSFFHGGAKDASDTFTSSLWALDFMHWWAAHGCAGLNFHTGDQVASNAELTVCRYAIYLTREGGGYDVKPIGYGLKAFDLVGRGRVLPVKIGANEKILNLTAYAVLGADKSIYVTLINKSFGTIAENAHVTINLASPVREVQQMALSVAGGDIAATQGVTLGGAPIAGDSTWKGTWTSLPAAQKPGQFPVDIPAATALMLKLGGP
jgi:hypothetical protein